MKLYRIAAFLMIIALLAAFVIAQGQVTYSASSVMILTLNNLSNSNFYGRGNVTVLMGSIGDSDNDTKLDIPTEMVQLELRGRGNIGNITIRLNNSTRTLGIVESKKNNTANVNNTNKTYPAASFFDVYFIIELEGRSNQTNATNSTNNTGGLHGQGNPPNKGIGRGTINNPRIQTEIPAMTLFNKEPLPIIANAVLKGERTNVHGYYRPLVKQIDLYDASNPNGQPVGKLKLVMLNWRKP